MDGVEVRTLTDGGQLAEDTANALAAFVAAAEKTVEVAIYDLKLPPELDEIVCGALVAASKRGVAVRLAYNVDYRKDVPPVPPPPITDPEAVEAMPFPTAAIPGVPDLMHHKYVVRDRAAVWTGSTNWTADSWTREENVIVTVESSALAARYLEDFEQLWSSRQVSHSGKVDTSPGGPRRRRMVLPASRGEARAPDRERDPLGGAPHPNRVTGDQQRPDPHGARTSRDRRKDRPCGGRGRDADRRSASAMARERDGDAESPRRRAHCCGRR